MVSTRTTGRDGAARGLWGWDGSALGDGALAGTEPLGLGAGDANLYRYVGNGPASESDPLGCQAAGTTTIIVVTGPTSPNKRKGGLGHLTGVIIPAPKNFLGMVACSMTPKTPPKKIGRVSGTGVLGGNYTTVTGVPPGSVAGSGGAGPCIGLIVTTPNGTVYVFHFTANDDPAATLGSIKFPKGSHAGIFGGDNSQPSNETLESLTPYLCSNGFLIDGYYPYDGLFTDGSFPPNYLLPPTAKPTPVPRMAE